MATKQPLSRAEEQIACLANMSTAKDMIIEEQKKSIKNLEQKLADEEWYNSLYLFIRFCWLVEIKKQKIWI